MSDQPDARTALKLAPTVQNRDLLYENRVFRIYLDHLVEAVGHEVMDYLVVEPKYSTGDLITGISVLPIVGGRLGLLRVYRHAVRRLMWELPRGFVEPGES